MDRQKSGEFIKRVGHQAIGMQRPVSERISKVDIKQMCKRFESIPSNENNKEIKEKESVHHPKSIDDIQCKAGFSRHAKTRQENTSDNMQDQPFRHKSGQVKNRSHVAKSNIEHSSASSSKPVDMVIKRQIATESNSLHKSGNFEIDSQFTPKAPARKHRNRHTPVSNKAVDKQQGHSSSSPLSNIKNNEDPAELDKIRRKKGCSVLERKRLFEVNSDSDKNSERPKLSVKNKVISHYRADINPGSVSLKSHIGEYKNLAVNSCDPKVPNQLQLPKRTQEDITVRNEKHGAEIFSSILPPSKPPRTFAHILNSEQNCASSVLCVDDEIDGQKLEVNGKTEELVIRRVISSKNDLESVDEITNGNRGNSGTSESHDPEINDRSNSYNKDALRKKTPKPQVILSNKAQSMIGYFKQLGTTANYICEKVKQKQPNIFVDLTPTTVSPPKHYDTLKRSFSDEHIYAEPLKLNAFKDVEPNNDLQTLHYMSTPLVKSRLQRKDFEKDLTNDKSHDHTPKEKKSSFSYVQNLIYQSFAMVRRTPSITSSNSHNSETNDDSESEVSDKDVQERIIYVKSVKKQNSVSSFCISPKLFEAVLILNLSDSEPEVVFKFPEKIKQGFDYPLIPHLCFPDSHLLTAVSTYESGTFCFTLADDGGERIFGYCHRILCWPEQSQSSFLKFPSAVCILSSISAPLFYKKVLSEIEKHLALPKSKCFDYIASLQKLGVPNAGASLSIPDYTELEENKRTIISRPLDIHTVSTDLTRVLQLLDVDLLLKAVASLLLERRVLLLSATSSNLFQCCEALLSLVYPFHWQHLVIPVLPSGLLVQCSTESPYLLGIASDNYNSILELLIEHQILIIDVDKGLIVKSLEDEDKILPKKVQKAVIAALNLAKNMTDPTEMLRDVMISEAFVHMFVEILGHYEDHIISQCGTLIIQKTAFQKNPSSQSIQAFLEWFSETQMFDAFVQESMWRRRYRNICQSQQLTLFEKRVDDYKWELGKESVKFSKFIGKRIRNIDFRNFKEEFVGNSSNQTSELKSIASIRSNINKQICNIV